MISISFQIPDTAAGAELVDVLLAAADARDYSTNEPTPRSALWRHIADALGDGLDQLPKPPET